ncbi:multiple coagulation factor deficiency protein 2 homolog [Cylas formicarius]|uniref:multiple coagulation factor deficiency protein 2 homolog n=1 Tax=Cylas formicarius TaxID=197179 RepID=UPI00295852AB|nr:multiple coagulation factor deficiency protein 2 homolog [Cylas formicarius]
MSQIASLTVLITIVALASGRGPHHPRGEPIVKRHTHYKPSRTAEKFTQDAGLLHDAEHTLEHLEEAELKPDVSKMTPEELELYYFLLHDSDKNSKLDGLELLQAILHTDHDAVGVRSEELNAFVEMVDQVLGEDDEDGDGYLSYAEYVEGRRRSQSGQQPNVSMVL